jgi:Zn-dependent M28 family amino/carboxypeptidase
MKLFRIRVIPRFILRDFPCVTLCPLWFSFLLSFLLVFVFVTTACSKGSSSPSAGNANAAASTPAPEPANATEFPADVGPLPQIDSKRAFQYIKEIVAFGTRPMGSENHKKVENYITSHLKGDQVEDDAFTADTVEGKFPVRNIIAKYPGTKDGIIVILSHYDTNYPLRNVGFVGANDGGSSSAILLEYANHLRGKKREGYSVWLVWTDGEEAVRQWSETDSLYGSRHLAERWEKDGTLKKIKALIVMDMIGDADLNIDRETNSTPWLSDLMYAAAERGGVQSHFYARSAAIDDDHLPFVKRGVPSLDVIDLDYGYGNVFHHTAQDTLDKLSPRSLEIVGNTTLEALQMLDRR